MWQTASAWDLFGRQLWDLLAEPARNFKFSLEPKQPDPPVGRGVDRVSKRHLYTEFIKHWLGIRSQVDLILARQHLPPHNSAF